MKKTFISFAFIAVILTFSFISILSAWDNFPLAEIPVNSCIGQGELFLYQQEPFQDIETSFVVDRNQVLVFTKDDPSLSAKVNGVPTPLVLVKEVSSPFHVKIYSLETSPGATVDINGTHQHESRSVQGYLAQDSEDPVFNLDTLEVVIDDERTSTFNLTSDNYSYIFFDKYSENAPGQGVDNRLLRVVINGTSGNIVDKSYTQPLPSPVEGVIADNFTVQTSGTYTLSVDTEDSIYWMIDGCVEPPHTPVCGDGYVDSGEQCDDGNTVNGDGCTNQCELPQCGDGIVRVGVEQCDDGNTANGDGCSVTCNEEEPVCEHDVGIRFSYSNSAGTGIAIRPESNATGWVLDNPAELTKGKNYTIKYFIDNKIENTTNNIHVVVKIDNQTLANYNNSINVFHSKEVVLDVSNLTFSGHNVTVFVEKINETDCNMSDNPASREILIVAQCGNSIVEQQEQCDGNDGVGLHQECTQECTLTNLPFCGDGVVNQQSEQCDDGNTADGDGCSSTCNTEHKDTNDGGKGKSRNPGPVRVLPTDDFYNAKYLGQFNPPVVLIEELQAAKPVKESGLTIKISFWLLALIVLLIILAIIFWLKQI